MIPASTPRAARDLRVLVADARGGPLEVMPATELPRLFMPGDLVVVNDAATLPASLPGTTARGEPVELRLVAGRGKAHAWTAALLGAGDHRTRTEERPPPPTLGAGDHVALGAGLAATITAVSALSPRLVNVELRVGRDGTDAAQLWAALYAAGRPVQYAHVPARLALWDVQNVFAARPWALEMPSAGRVLDGACLLDLRARGVALATVTHAAGISSTGDPAIDALLPLPERYDVPASTVEAVRHTDERGGRVVAVGTTVVRALEGAARAGDGVLIAGEGTTDLRLGPETRRRVVDAVLSGVHEAGTSHFELLRAFAPEPLLRDIVATAGREGLFGHELGDACLLWGSETVRHSASHSRGVWLQQGAATCTSRAASSTRARLAPASSTSATAPSAGRSSSRSSAGCAPSLPDLRARARPT